MIVASAVGVRTSVWAGHRNAGYAEGDRIIESLEPLEPAPIDDAIALRLAVVGEWHGLPHLIANRMIKLLPDLASQGAHEADRRSAYRQRPSRLVMSRWQGEQSYGVLRDIDSGGMSQVTALRC